MNASILIEEEAREIPRHMFNMKMTKDQQAVFDRFWKIVEPGIPVTEPFDLGVVKTHAEMAFAAGWRAGHMDLQIKREQFAAAE